MPIFSPQKQEKQVHYTKIYYTTHLPIWGFFVVDWDAIIVLIANVNLQYSLHHLCIPQNMNISNSILHIFSSLNEKLKRN